MSLHSNQQKLLRLLSDNIDDPLTVRQLMEELGVNSPNLVQHHIIQLEKKGYLKRDPGNPANYQVLSDPEAPISFLNLYGLAKCGPDGMILTGNPIDRIPIASKLISFAIDDAFLVKADGDSMEPEIRHGDFVICKAQKRAYNGEIVICSYKESGMIKRFRELEANQIILESINSDFTPIIVTDINDLHIEGIFSGLIRR
jgi:repressor LexA